MKTAVLLVAVFVGAGALSGATQARQAGGQQGAKEAAAAGRQARSVKGQVLISSEAPALLIKFDRAFKYVGSQEFILYDVARAEQHFFVDADAQGRIRRMYWVQFEGYLPSNTHTYDYKGTRTVRLAGLDFIADAFAMNVNANRGRPDSDSNRARAFLEGKGYRLAGDEVMSQRLVHLLDETKRSEMLIIYVEDMGGTGLTAADLSPGGRAAGRWDEISKGLLARALKGIQVSR